MDLGCGTGILSMFCAKLGGAKQVSIFVVMNESWRPFNLTFSDTEFSENMKGVYEFDTI